MKKIIVHITDDLSAVENAENLLKKEREAVMPWREQGILEHVFSKTDHNGAFLIFQNTDIEDVKNRIQSLPLFPYFTKVEYSEVTKTF